MTKQIQTTRSAGNTRRIITRTYVLSFGFRTLCAKCTYLEHF